MGQESTREEPWTNAVEKTISMVGKYLKVCVCVCVFAGWVGRVDMPSKSFLTHHS